MIKINKIFLDGTALDKEVNVAEFSKDHASVTVRWSLFGDEESGFQDAFEIVLKDDAAGTLAESGKINSREQCFDINCEELAPESFFTLTLNVKSGNSEDTKTVRLYNGALKEFPGKWITDSRFGDTKVMSFAKTFETRKEVKTAVLYSCGLGYSVPTINGERVSDAVLDPAHSNYAKVCYFRVSVDAAKLLKKGGNRIEVSVAPGWRNNKTDFLVNMTQPRQIEFFGPTELWAMLKITYVDGTVDTIVTDETWSAHVDPRTADIFNGETFDARLCGDNEDFPASPAEAPGGKMRPMLLQPIKKQEIYEPVEIIRHPDGSFVVDFGQNMAAVASLKLPQKLSAGQKITLTFSEELDEDGTVYTLPLRDAKQTDTYVAAGDGRDLSEWMPEFTYHGFRYCCVRGLENLEAGDIKAVSLYTDIKNRTYFSCGSPQLSAVHKIAVMTEKSNVHSILTDCPQRDERMGWMNDATVRFEETPYNFDVSRIFPKVCLDIKNEQREEGQFTCCCPFVYGGLPADPVCSSYLVAAKSALMHCGELNAVDELFDGMAAWEDFLLSRSPDGTVDYSYYGDWAAPCYACPDEEYAINTTTPGVLMSTGYSYFNCVTLADFARRTGRTGAFEKYTEKAEYVRKAFLEKWFDYETAKVAGGSMGAQAFALWLGILPAALRKKAARVMHDDLVSKDFQFTTGNLNTRYLVDMLTEYGYVDDVYTLLTKETYPSYGYMLQNEATTVWERFELKKNPGMNSHNHPMYGAVDYWFFRYLLGVEIVDPGFEKVRIKPYFPEKLLSAHAVVDTVMGEISVRWSKRYGKTYLFVDIPFGMTAEVDFNGKTTICSGYNVFEA